MFAIIRSDLLIGSEGEGVAYMYDTLATQQEIEFLKGLGTHTAPDNAPILAENVLPEIRIALLEKYWMAMSRRANWGHINPVPVKRAVLQLIADLL